MHQKKSTKAAEKGNRPIEVMLKTESFSIEHCESVSSTDDETLPPLTKRVSIVSYESDSEDELSIEVDQMETETSRLSLSREEQRERDAQGRTLCCNIAKSAMSLTTPASPAHKINEGRFLLSEATAMRTVPGLQSSFAQHEVTVEDCLTAYYLSEANKNLGRGNSAHYYLQEALTLVESFVLRIQKAERIKQGKSADAYQSAGVDARKVLEEWTAPGSSALEIARSRAIMSQ